LHNGTTKSDPSHFFLVTWILYKHKQRTSNTKTQRLGFVAPTKRNVSSLLLSPKKIEMIGLRNCWRVVTNSFSKQTPLTRLTWQPIVPDTSVQVSLDRSRKRAQQIIESFSSFCIMKTIWVWVWLFVCVCACACTLYCVLTSHLFVSLSRFSGRRKRHEKWEPPIHPMYYLNLFLSVVFVCLCIIATIKHSVVCCVLCIEYLRRRMLTRVTLPPREHWNGGWKLENYSARS
jgi:hypothetical protein